MQLIKEQVELIEESINARKKLDGDYHTQFVASKTDKAYGYIGYNPDSSIEFAYHNNKNELLRLLAILEDPETKIVEEVSTTSIEVGTTFSVQFSDEDEEETFTLVEALTGLENRSRYVSLESPFGRSILHKGEDETFEYVTKINDRSVSISGTITSIENTNAKAAPKEFIKNSNN